MLVLTRRMGEAIGIGRDAAVVVLEYRSGQVKLGIVAPRETVILRAELMEEPTQSVIAAEKAFDHGR
jgi:carbon storage regulator